MELEPKPRFLSFQDPVQSGSEDDNASRTSARRLSAMSEASTTSSSRRISVIQPGRKTSKSTSYVSPYRLWRRMSDSIRDQAGNMFQGDEKKQEVENTYRMEPKRKFPEREVREIIKNSLEALLGELTYSGSEFGFLTKLLSSRIMEQVKSLNIERYKLVCVVNVGSKHNQGLRVVSRCLWNPNSDTHATASIENGTLFAVATVYGIYFEFDSVQGLDRREEEMSRFFHLVVILVSFLYQSIATARQDLHTFLSKDELRRYLQTDSYETVPEYDVVKVHNHRSKRNEFSTKQDYRLSAFGKDFALTLQPNDDVIPDTGLPIERRKRDGVVVKEIHHPHGRFYEGQLTSDPNSHVTVRETDKKGQLSGAIVSDGHLYHLEPLPDHLHRRAVLQGPGYHVISKRSARDLPNQKFMSTHNKEGTQEHEEVQDDQSETEKTRMKRDDVYKGNIYIEAMLTADKTTCDFYGNETLDYLLNIANLVSRLYKDKSIGMPVSWVLTKVFLIEGFDPDLDFAANNIRSAGSYFWKYKSWTLNRNTANGKQEHYDIAALLTRSVCGLNSCSINGVANKGLCGKYPGVSINVAIGLGAAYTVTHDMAHNIGLGHDTGDCHKMGAIMHRQQAYGPKAFHWSPCSMNQLKQRFTLHKCLHNQPSVQIPLPSLPPLFSADEQ
ncbi:A disintegrin and metalloproteinase with thrombospondin motifs 8 [Stylophora pistillata]|uniref:A disintegrin and metalloproteinase with thrombospondin motifs 8 n=2 Tax=Stylophora pistillata TaxID=50429 RepID=A0A2B4SSZ8_STYPI|nr:A disintegrin and metalloproteinase with thrombospondin motifs 8 [Stylophora pistillata]